MTNDKTVINEAVSNKENGKQGLVIYYNHSGVLPGPSEVKIYVGDREDIKPGSKVDMYYFNSNTEKLESLPDSEYTVDKDGYVTVKITHCSNYVLIPKPVSETVKIQDDGSNTMIKQGSIPVIAYVKTPGLEYKAGDTVNFDLYTPNYGGRIQYRVVLWDDKKKEARDIWVTGDRYYTNWMPYGNNTFNLHWRIDEPGSYRITVYVKRAGIQNSSTALREYNCDSYIESEAFVVK